MRNVIIRDKLLLVASEEVITKMIRYENEGINKGADLHDHYLTELIKALRVDLQIKDKKFPTVYMKSWNKKPKS